MTTYVAATGSVVSAHPELGHPHVDVPVLVVALGAALLVTVVALANPVRVPGEESDAEPATSWAGSLSSPQVVTRAVALLFLVAAIVAGRVGVANELENLAPALVVGAGLPLLVLGSLALGSLWRWLDPWDAAARLVAPRDASEPPGHVWPAVAIVLPCLWFLSVHPRPLDPRAVGAALAAYSVVTVAGCVALGRARWLGSAEPFGLVLSWLGLVPRRMLSRWQPPRGAGVLLGVTVGGLVFGLLRRTEVWVPVLSRDAAVLWSTVGLAGACLLGGGLAALIGRGTTRATLVARSLVPVVAATVLAVGLERNRLFTSLQLLPGLVGDPLGHGWDLLGPAAEGLSTAPLGAVGLVSLQIAVVVAGHVLAAFLVTRPHVGDDRLPAIAVLTTSVVAVVASVSIH